MINTGTSLFNIFLIFGGTIMEKEKILYSAIFLNSESIKKLEAITGLKTNVENIHSTLTFMPNEAVPAELLGKTVKIQVIASGWYSPEGIKKNFGLKIAEGSLPEEVREISKNAQKGIQHVTVLVKNGGEAVDTWLCQWNTPLNFELEGKVGYCTVEEPSKVQFN